LSSTCWAPLLLHQVELMHLIADGFHVSSQMMRVSKLGFLHLHDKHGLIPITRPG
jgi:hypothetical protein